MRTTITIDDELYRKALDIQPNEPSVLSNLGMSYLLSDDLKTAETYMRSAASAPRRTPDRRGRRDRSTASTGTACGRRRSGSG
mgnify:CR=1 FL=1